MEEVKEQSTETQLALMRQSIVTLTGTIGELKADLHKNNEFFASKEQLQTVKRELEDSIKVVKTSVNDVRQSIKSVVRWFSGLGLAVATALVIAFLSRFHLG